MSWKHDFSAAVQFFRKGELQSALESFNQAIDSGGETEYIVYDSRSAILEKLGRRKDALKDARSTIQLAPDQWQGYARAARLFHQTHKFDSATKMVDAALKRLKADDAKRRKDLLTLKDDISLAQDEFIRKTTNHWGHLPIELFADIASILVEEQPTHLILLSQVCKDWRRAVWDNPRLWTTLVLGRSRPHIKAKRWVERSKGSIHTLKVQAVACNRASWNGEGLEGIRWSQLKICKVENWDVCKFLNQSNSISSLSSLTHYEYHNEDRRNNVQHPFHVSWPIQHLSLTSIALPPSFGEMAEKNLRGLALHKILGKVNLALEYHQSLEKLILDTIEVVLEELPGELPALEHLEIYRVTRPMLALLNLSMPRLNTLHIESSPFSLGSSLDSLQSKSSGHLTTLVLKGMPLTEPLKLIDLLRANPRLIRLELSRIHAGAVPVVEALHPPLPSTPISDTANSSQSSDRMCPQLNHLDVSHCHDMRTGPLVRLIKSRNATSSLPSSEISKISTLVVEGCEHIEADWIPWFKNHVENFSHVNWAKRQRR